MTEAFKAFVERADTHALPTWVILWTGNCPNRFDPVARGWRLKPIKNRPEIYLLCRRFQDTWHSGCACIRHSTGNNLDVDMYDAIHPSKVMDVISRGDTIHCTQGMIVADVPGWALSIIRMLEHQ